MSRYNLAKSIHPIKLMGNFEPLSLPLFLSTGLGNATNMKLCVTNQLRAFKNIRIDIIKSSNPYTAYKFFFTES